MGCSSGYGIINVIGAGITSGDLQEGVVDGEREATIQPRRKLHIVNKIQSNNSIAHMCSTHLVLNAISANHGLGLVKPVSEHRRCDGWGSSGHSE